MDAFSRREHHRWCAIPPHASRSEPSKECRNTSWNSGDAARGCSQQDFAKHCGAGLFYRFAID
jgi:hypothetical protein